MSSDPTLTAAGFTYLAEALSTFEMTQRSYWEAKHHADSEHAIALALQHDLLPRVVPEVTGLDISVRYLPGEIGSHAGGDWYDIFELDPQRVGLVVGDVTGHGVRAAAAMGRLRVAVLAHALDGLGPSEVIKRVDALLDQLDTGELASMVYVVADPGRGKLVVANAGIHHRSSLNPTAQPPRRPSARPPARGTPADPRDAVKTSPTSAPADISCSTPTG